MATRLSSPIQLMQYATGKERWTVGPGLSFDLDYR